jgi:hypothetical protein
MLKKSAKLQRRFQRQDNGPRNVGKEQSIAPGTSRSSESCSEGARQLRMSIVRRTSCVAPSGLTCVSSSVPGALPQAILCQPFGLLMNSPTVDTYSDSSLGRSGTSTSPSLRLRGFGRGKPRPYEPHPAVGPLLAAPSLIWARQAWYLSAVEKCIIGGPDKPERL